MANDAVLRPAVAADAAALTAIVTSAYAAYRAAGVALPPVEVGLADDIATRTVWVAVIDGHLVGGLVLALDDLAHLMNVAVDPAVSGQGLGARLLAQAETLAAQAGYARITLTTHRDLTATQAFYIAKGWTRTGTDGLKIYLSKDITAAASDPAS